MYLKDAAPQAGEADNLLYKTFAEINPHVLGWFYPV